MKWSEVTGYEGLYEVSDTGLVRGVDRFVTDKNGIKRSWKGRMIAFRLNSRGYLSVKLYKNGKSRTLVIHRLVATAFILNPHKLPLVNHLDGNKVNNEVINLEWVTPSINVKHAYDMGLNPQRGCTHRLAVAIIDTVTGEIYCTQKALSDHLGVDYGNLKNVLKGNRPFPKSWNLDGHCFEKYTC